MGDFVLSGGVGFCNAVRRCLISDVRLEAPFEVEIRCNTSFQTDEFIAQRVGLIPFRRVGNGDSLTLNVEGRSATAADFTGPAFEPCEDVEVMRMAPGQRLDMTVRFDIRTGRSHARYSKCAGVGMSKVDGQRYRITFHTIDHSNTVDTMREALDALESHVENALRQLSDQSDPPKTMC